MIEDPSTLIVALAVAIGLLGLAAGVAFLVARTGRTAVAIDPSEEQRVPERLTRELERCLDLGDSVLRDADYLSSILADELTRLPAEVANATIQLIKTSKSLAARLNRCGLEGRLVRPALDSRALSLSVVEAKPGQSDVRPTSAALKRGKSNAAAYSINTVCLPGSPFGDVRSCPRSSFRGSAAAMIYPLHPGPGRGPVQGIVLTHDLSCGGIRFAYTQQLFPKQIVVLEFAGKLLVAEIRWCRRTDEAVYVAGCRLLKVNH